MENFIEIKDVNCDSISFYREKEEDNADGNSPIVSPNEVSNRQKFYWSVVKFGFLSLISLLKILLVFLNLSS